MLLRQSLPRITAIRFIAAVKIKSPSLFDPAVQSIGESQFAKEIMTKHPEKVNYLNDVLICSEKRRIEKYDVIMEGRRKLIQRLEDKICTENSRLIAVGSSATGLSSDANADMDLCFYTKDPDFYKDFRAHPILRNYIFTRMRHLIYELCAEDKDDGLYVVGSEAHINAYVPLQIFRFSNGLSLDIQMQADFHSIRNTNLVKHYSLADPRFPQVYFYMKRIFEVLGLKNSKEGLISSYHLMMLTIHFLQFRLMSKPVLPVLCSTIPHRVGPDIPIEKVLDIMDGKYGEYTTDWKSENTQSAAELILEMINYYKNIFDAGTTQIYIQRGLVIKRHPSKKAPVRLEIFDPYSAYSICRSHFIPDAFTTGIRYIYHRLSCGFLIDTYPHFDDARGFEKFVEEKPWGKLLKCK